MLFKDYLRTNAEAKSGMESSFQFLERSSWRRCVLMRTILNGWMVSMIDDKAFISQIKSKSDKQHYAALFELLVYTALTNIGFTVGKHPELSKKTTPDFEIRKDDITIFMECTLSGNSFESLEEENRKSAIERIIREIHYYPYFINIDFLTISETSISKKALLNFIDGKKEKCEGIGNEQLFHNRYYFENNGWKLEISLLRKTDPSIKVSLGFITGEARVIDGAKAILGALNDKKPSKYGINNSPYAICLSNSDMFFKDEEMNEILFGGDGSSSINLSYATKKGFFYCDGVEINTSVSAILIFKGFDILTLSSAKISIWHNPFAKYPIPLNLLPFDEFFYTLDGFNLKKESILKTYNVLDILSINESEYEHDPKSIGSE